MDKQDHAPSHKHNSWDQCALDSTSYQLFTYLVILLWFDGCFDGCSDVFKAQIPTHRWQILAHLAGCPSSEHPKSDWTWVLTIPQTHRPLGLPCQLYEKHSSNQTEVFQGLLVFFLFDLYVSCSVSSFIPGTKIDNLTWLGFSHSCHPQAFPARGMQVARLKPQSQHSNLVHPVWAIILYINRTFNLCACILDTSCIYYCDLLWASVTFIHLKLGLCYRDVCLHAGSPYIHVPYLLHPIAGLWGTWSSHHCQGPCCKKACFPCGTELAWSHIRVSLSPQSKRTPPSPRRSGFWVEPTFASVSFCSMCHGSACWLAMSK